MKVYSSNSNCVHALHVLCAMAKIVSLISWLERKYHIDFIILLSLDSDHVISFDVTYSLLLRFLAYYNA